jgi:hypothetical protein
MLQGHHFKWSQQLVISFSVAYVIQEADLPFVHTLHMNDIRCVCSRAAACISVWYI